MILRAVLGGLLFRDDLDRYRFLDILSREFGKAGMECFAWVLMGNHVHLLVETGEVPLSAVIHRVATKYAVAFNKRHGGQGHVFQGRFHSVPVEDDAQFDEVLRYIHLNPVRAGVLPDLEALAGYRWTSHAAMIGTAPPRFAGVEAALGRFSEDAAEAREALIEFLHAGLDPDEHPRAPSPPADARQPILDDAYPLDRSRLIDRAHRDRDARDDERLALRRAGWTIDTVIRDVCRRTGALEQRVRAGRRSAPEAMARSVIAYLGVRKLGMTHSDVGRAIGVTRSAVSLCLERGCELWETLEPLEDHP